MLERYTGWVIRWRYAVVFLTVLAAGLAGSGARFLVFDTDYRVFFSEENPQLSAFDALQDIYSKNDNALIILAPADGNVFQPGVLTAVEELTHDAWQVPFATRVDSISNFQHTRAEQDDLLVEDLVLDAAHMSAEAIAEARDVAVNEPLLRNRLISESGHVTGVNVTVQLPGKSSEEVMQSAAHVRELAAGIEQRYPHIKTYITGMVMMNNAFPEASMRDMASLVPMMYGIIILVMIGMLRSVSGTVGTFTVVLLSMITAMGIAGWSGFHLTPPSASAPTIVMTLAVAHSIHILVSLFHGMRHGESREDALRESLRINMQPVFLTSLTTLIGFLSMNFSDAPPFRDLGNITAFGVVAGFIYSVLFLPALMAILPVRVKPGITRGTRNMDRMADFVVRRRQPLFWAMGALVLGLALCIPRIELNDEFVKYFDETVAFRTDTDFAMANLTGIYQIQYSVPSGQSSGISQPEYQDGLDRFAQWFRQQAGVVHVNVLTDIMKRLNRNMHADDDSWYRLPESRELAAQYLLLYEMSLPFGLDLNDTINVDKSATRMIVTLENMDNQTLRQIEQNADAWIAANLPPAMHTVGSSPSIMFAYIAERNIKSMLQGTLLAVLLIAIVLIVALRSVLYGLLSLVPNVFPAVMAFGVWALVVGEVGLALSVVTAMTLGIVVDDTVHFLSKYLRARREKGLAPPDAVRYAFHSVGMALWITSVILVAGFTVLAQSSFELNDGMGKLTATIIAFALFADFLFLPPLLLLIEEKIRAKTVAAEPVESAAT